MSVEIVNIFVCCVLRSRLVVDCKDIVSVVGMIPLPLRPEEAAHPNAAQLYSERYFVAEKLVFDMSRIGREEDLYGEDIA